MNSNFAKKLFLITAMFFLFADLSAQTGKSITVDMENGSLKTLLELIEKQSGYVFSYRDDAIDKKVVSVDLKDAPVSQVLDRALAGTNLSYKIVSDNSIIITEASGSNQRNEPKITVSGTVIDSTGEPVIGGSVVVKGTQIGATTDIDGNYTLGNVPSDATIVFSYVGCNPLEIKASNTAALSKVELKEDLQVLDEVVVVGYGVQKKRDVSTAISQIKSDDIANLPSSDFRQSMAGKMPGVSVMQTSGDPEGNNMMVRVRGVSSAARTLTCAAASALCGAMVCGLADYLWNYPRVMCIFWFVFAVALSGTKICRAKMA